MSGNAGGMGNLKALLWIAPIQRPLATSVNPPALGAVNHFHDLLCNFR
jgi:hypothetical protein